MRANENPGVGTGASEGLAGGLTTSNDNRYPLHIKISDAAEVFIEQLATDLMLGTCELSQLPPSLSAFYTFAWSSGRDTLEREVDRLQFECDRLWMWAFNPPPKINPNAKSHADLERIRGNSANADRIDAANAARFEQVDQ
ncbi:MAG: hypothetical protein V4531_08490 [Actinomycetota bacterium]